MTAELAVVLPAVLVVLAACVGVLRVGVEQARLDAAAGVASRSAARGDDPAIAARLGIAAGARSISLSHRAELVCARAGTVVVVLGLPVRIEGTACALSS